MTTLREYLDRPDTITATEMAHAIGCSRQAICNYKYSRRIPPQDQAAKIHELTAGEVCVSQWYPDLVKALKVYPIKELVKPSANQPSTNSVSERQLSLLPAEVSAHG